jgi:CspA family cold shock protein
MMGSPLLKQQAAIAIRYFSANNILTGTVKWFDSKKGFGFIQPDDGSVRYCCGGTWKQFHWIVIFTSVENELFDWFAVYRILPCILCLFPHCSFAIPCIQEDVFVHQTAIHADGFRSLAVSSCFIAVAGNVASRRSLSLSYHDGNSLSCSSSFSYSQSLGWRTSGIQHLD